MSGYGSPRPQMPTPVGGDTDAFEKKLAQYGFQPEGFEKISTTQARATGLAVRQDDFLSQLEGGGQEHDEEEQEEEDKVAQKLQQGPGPGRPNKRSTPYRRYALILLVVALVGGGAVIGALTGTGLLFSTEETDSPTSSPTSLPTLNPTLGPTRSPTTPIPTRSPVPTALPTSAPSLGPTSAPTTSNPTRSPTLPTQLPTSSPTHEPTFQPTNPPTRNPTRQPTRNPTRQPTNAPTFAPLTNAELKAIMASRLTLRFGWRDSCSTCTNGPSKFADLFDSSCSVTGSDSNCISQNGVVYGGINTDGTVNDDDRFYMSLSASSLSCGLASNAACATGNPTEQAIYALGFLCVAIGWRDSCNGCTDGPAKISEVCVDSSLSTTVTGTNSQSGSINTDGSVNGDDKFYARGFVHASAPSQPLLTYARNNCRLTFGWRDSCDGCTNEPSKRGNSQFNGACNSIVGSDSNCAGSFVGINTDGTVNGDDKFYLAFTCT